MKIIVITLLFGFFTLLFIKHCIDILQLREAISGPSIVDETTRGRSKPRAIERQTTMTSTVGGVNLEFDKDCNDRGDETNHSKRLSGTL